MPLRGAQASNASLETVNKAIAQLLRAPGLLMHVLNKPQAGRPSLTAPHIMHGISLRDIADGRGVETAQPTILRFLVLEAESVIALAEVSIDAAGNAEEFRKFTRGPSVQGTVEAIAAAEAMPQVQAGAFELRAIGISPLHVQALWLKDEGDDADIVIPVFPVPPPLIAGRPQSPSEFFSSLQDNARRMLSITERVEA